MVVAVTLVYGGHHFFVRTLSKGNGPRYQNLRPSSLIATPTPCCFGPKRLSHYALISNRNFGDSWARSTLGLRSCSADCSLVDTCCSSSSARSAAENTTGSPTGNCKRHRKMSLGGCCHDSRGRQLWRRMLERQTKTRLPRKVKETVS
jgi:hypothetical protein